MWGYTSNRTFHESFLCSSTAFAGKDVNEGDKIFLPPSAFEKLAKMNIEYPMLFEVTNPASGRVTHCGILEFSAEEGYCYMPYWMMQNLVIEEGTIVNLKNVSLKKAVFVKFRAQSVDFLEVTNPRALLEVSLRKFTCLTVGDIICIPHGMRHFYLEVREVQPEGAASIIETDCNVDFEEPLGYQDSKYAQYEKQAAEAKLAASVPKPRVLQKARAEDELESDNSNKFTPFAGTAKRIDGKSGGSAVQTKSEPESKKDFKTNDSKLVENKTQSPTPKFQTSIGDKYSKKKVAVGAFSGVARTLG